MHCDASYNVYPEFDEPITVHIITTAVKSLQGKIFKKCARYVPKS